MILAAVLTACVPTDDIQVTNKTSKKVNFKGYKRYQFLEGSGLVESDKKGNMKSSDDESAALIEHLINEALQKRGKYPVSKDPDFYVAYLGGKEMSEVEDKLNAEGKRELSEAPSAAMILMLIDADSGAILRISTAEGKVTNLPEAEQKKRISYAIDNMLKGI